MNLALFDIDGTLVMGRSEVMFWRFLFRHGRQGPRQLLTWAGFALRHLPGKGTHAVRINKAPLRLIGANVNARKMAPVHCVSLPVGNAGAPRSLDD